MIFRRKEENEYTLYKDNIRVENLIYEIDGKQVMIDDDLARLYETETKRINEAVYRNKDKFPERYCFRISENDYNILKSHNATSKGGSRKGHTVFTEQGIAMLATVLKTPIATKVSIAIMDAFVVMRRYISTNLVEQKYINDIVLEHDSKIKILQKSLDKLSNKTKENNIYFNGQIYDAYFKIYEIFNETNNKLIIIDNYADNTILDIIKRLSIKVIIITKRNNLLTEQDINKYNEQYHNLKVIYNNTFHDRYFIIDDKIVYHCGASVNRIGYKTFSITLISDNSIANVLISKIKNLEEIK